MPVRLDHKIYYAQNGALLFERQVLLSEASGPSNIQRLLRLSQHILCPFLGDLSEEDPPVPIPNTAVKLLSPDGTA